MGAVEFTFAGRLVEPLDVIGFAIRGYPRCAWLGAGNYCDRSMG